MFLFEKEFTLPATTGNQSLLEHLENSIRFQMPHRASPLRMAVTDSSKRQFDCEVGILEGYSGARKAAHDSIFRFVPRERKSSSGFNAALIVPTGIGSEIGGHAGDATPVSRLLGSICDLVVTHPNVVNASDINEMPENSLYVEGSVLSRFLMGTIGLRRIRSNRVLVVIDDNPEKIFVNAAINAVNAARGTYGLDCPKIIQMNPPLIMRSTYTDAGSAAGEVENLDYLFQVLGENREVYDAVAISSVIKVPEAYHQEYFDRKGEMVNPWGGVEAMLTHAVSNEFDVPSAHSPMFETPKIANVDPGIVDPRMAAEAVSLTFLQCILKGLQRSPRIVTEESQINSADVLTSADISCLVMPDGCLGLPTLAALEQGIPVIAVRENKNLMKNDLSRLPWKAGQFHLVENYWEAVGLMAALKSGINPGSVRRPINATVVEKRSFLEEKSPADADTDVIVEKT